MECTEQNCKYISNCGGCKHELKEDFEYPCNNCKRNWSDKFEQFEESEDK